MDRSEVRILLTAGDKAGRWKEWYVQHIPQAEERYARWLAGDYDEETT